MDGDEDFTVNSQLMDTYQITYSITDEQLTELHLYILDEYQYCQEMEVEPSEQLTSCMNIVEEVIGQHT